MRESKYLETFDTMFDRTKTEEHLMADKVFRDRSEKQHQHAQTLLKELLEPQKIEDHKYFAFMFEAQHYPK